MIVNQMKNQNILMRQFWERTEIFKKSQADSYIVIKTYFSLE
jgi:hypothetical protein